jgi:hypothetical membrane protein
LHAQGARHFALPLMRGVMRHRPCVVLTEILHRRAAVVATAVFWPALFVFAAIYPGYSHLHRAVSGLGAFGAPHALAWNIIGFIVPGLLLAVCGGSVALAIEGRRSVLFWLLVISGLGFAGAGIFPAEMRNGIPVMQSPWTAGHVLMISLSGFPWMIAAFVLVGRVRRNDRWRRLLPVTLTLAVVALLGLALNVLAGSIPMLADVPGLAQRLAFAVYFGWFLVVGALFSATTRDERATA